MTARGFAARPRVLVIAAAALLLVNVAVIVAALHLTRSTSSDKVITRNDPIADALGWIPATSDTERAFSIWADSSDPARLSMTPAPLVLGHSAAWRTRYGYGAENVSAWAVAGRGSSISVLRGSFDWSQIERTLLASGFTKSTYHRAVIFAATTPGPSENVIIDGDSSGSGRAIGLLDGRVIAAASADLVRSVVDAAQGRTKSLADVASVGAAVSSLQPMVGLMAIAQTDQAIACGVGRGWGYGDVAPSANRLVFVAYGSLGTGGAPRTLVAMTFENEAAAEGALPAYDEGWRAGFANAGGSGGAISTFGTVTNVSRIRAMLVAEISNGTERGWARAGVRFAVAVCSASADALPPGTPAPAATPPS